MAIQRYTHEYMEPRLDANGAWVTYADHIAECRERERAAFVAGARWERGEIWKPEPAEAEAERRYGEERGK